MEGRCQKSPGAAHGKLDPRPIEQRGRGRGALKVTEVEYGKKNCWCFR